MIVATGARVEGEVERGVARTREGEGPKVGVERRGWCFFIFLFCLFRKSSYSLNRIITMENSHQ